MNESLISGDKLGNFLLVEGNDDYHVCYHLLTSHKIKIFEEVKFIDEQGQTKTREQGQVKIINKQGIGNLLQTLEVELLRSDLKHLGILVDADEDLIPRTAHHQGPFTYLASLAGRARKTNWASHYETVS